MFDLKLCSFTGEGIIIAQDRLSGQLKSTSPSHYRLPYFVYTGCRCRIIFYTGWNPFLYQHFVIYPGVAGVEDVSLVYTSTLIYTGTPGVNDEVPV